MKMGQEPLITGQYYHIYNRGNNGCDLFLEPDCYEHFLNLYDTYIHPVAETFAWVLMGNHFHLLLRIKENRIYRYDLNDDSFKKNESDLNYYKKWETVEATSSAVSKKMKKPLPFRHFAHLFNAYSRYHQNRYGRTGNLFERPFKRKLVDNESYFKKVILYIHQNPVHHGFCSHPLEYPWSSYITCTSEKPTWLKREAVKKLFGSNKNFEEVHLNPVDKESLDSWLRIDKVDYYTEMSIGETKSSGVNYKV